VFRLYFLMLDRQRSIVSGHLSVVLSGNWVTRLFGTFFKHASSFDKVLGCGHWHLLAESNELQSMTNVTDEVLNLKTGEADIAIRYARSPPPEIQSVELFRDRFKVVASLSLVGSSIGNFSPADLATFPLIDFAWPPTDAEAPTWSRWEIAARQKYALVPPLGSLVSLSFREEPHAIDAVLAGQGIALCSDILVAGELAVGTVRQLSDITLPGYTHYLSYRSGHPMRQAIKEFLAWSQDQIRT
jgi:LysR family glycine cleavage system transcriptional activator